MNQLELTTQGNYTIFLCKEHWKSVVIQIISAQPVLKHTAEGTIEERHPIMAWEKRVDMVKYDPHKNVLPLDAEEFRKQVLDALAEAKHQLARLLQIDAMYDGIYRDLESQHKALAKG